MIKTEMGSSLSKRKETKMVQAKMAQRRIYRRFSFDGDVNLESAVPERRFTRAYLSDISLGGLQMHSRERIPVNEKVNFSVTTSLLRDCLLGKGRVRHVTLIKKSGDELFYIGIKFDHIKRNRIKELVRKVYPIREEPLLSPQHRKELSFIAKISPLLILAILLVIALASAIDNTIIQSRMDSIWTEKVKEGIVYFLYNAK